MADALDDLDDLDDLGDLDDLDDLEGLDAGATTPDEPKKGDKTKKAKAGAVAEPAATPLILRIVLGVAGLMLVVGFFLPWIRLDAINPEQAARTQDVTYVNGLELAVSGDTLITTAQGATPWAVLFLIPLFGAALTAVGFLGNRFSGIVGALLGVLIVGYGLVTFVLLFFRVTNYGLWVVLGGAVVAVAGGTFAWARSRTTKRVVAKSPVAKTKKA